MGVNISRGMNTTTTMKNGSIDMQVRQMDPKIYQVRANFAAFVVLLRLMTMKSSAKVEGKSGYKIGAKNCKSYKFEWGNIEVDNPSVAAVAAATNVATSVTVGVGKGNLLTINDLVYNVATGELMRVTNIVGDVISVVRGVGAESGQAVAIGDTLLIAGSAFEEGSGAPRPISFVPETDYNLTQIFKMSVENSRTNEETEHYGNINTLKMQKSYAWDKYLLERSLAYLVGKRSSVTGADGKPQRTTGGLDSFVTSNIMVKTAFSYNNFMDFAEMAYGYGGDEKIFICNPAMATLLQKEVLANKIIMDISPKSKEFGIDINRIKTVHGSMDFIIDQTMKRAYTKPTGFALETQFIEEMVLTPDRWEENIQIPGTDGRKDQIIGECGLKVVNPKRHAKLIIGA